MKQNFFFNFKCSYKEIIRKFGNIYFSHVFLFFIFFFNFYFRLKVENGLMYIYKKTVFSPGTFMKSGIHQAGSLIYHCSRFQAHDIHKWLHIQDCACLVFPSIHLSLTKIFFSRHLLENYCEEDLILLRDKVAMIMNFINPFPPHSSLSISLILLLNFL